MERPSASLGSVLVTSVMDNVRETTKKVLRGGEVR